jgi:hypothetical protein
LKASTAFSWLIIGFTAAFEPFGTIKGEEFIDHLSDYQLPKIDPVT